MIASPCTGVCRLDENTALCGGCLRTREEIACWGAASDAHRRRILQFISGREAAGHVRTMPGENT